MSQEDEDSLTGDLGGALAGHEVFEIDGRAYSVHTTYRKFRGRGKGALEKSTGADGIFEIEVRDWEGNIVCRKGLLFQAKKEWESSDNRLRRQAENLARIRGSAIVVDYTVRGYSAVTAESVVEAEGDRRRVPEDEVSALGDMLADLFATCRAGRRDLYYDAARRQLIFALRPGEIESRRFLVTHRIRTVIESRHVSMFR